LSGIVVSRRDFLKLLGAGAMIGVVEKFANFTSNRSSRQVSAISLGSWAYGQKTSFPTIHTALLKNGKIFYAAGTGWQSKFFPGTNNPGGPYKAGLLDVTASPPTETILPDQTDDLFCCGFAQLADGKIVITGGTTFYDVTTPNSKNWGGRFAYEFDPDSNSLIKISSMAAGRWYPAMGTLPNGKIFVNGGLDDFGVMNNLTEVYDPVSKTFTIRYDPTANRTYCVGQGETVTGAGSPCYGSTNKGVNPALSYYSRTIVMPSGLVFLGGMKQAMYLWNPDDPGSNPRSGLQPSQWYSLGNMNANGRVYGCAVLLPLNNTTSENGKILLAGGRTTNNVILNSSEFVDFNAGISVLNPVISNTTSMAKARMYTLPVILPTGKIIIFGGTFATTTDYVYTPEMFDPTNNSWTSLPDATIGRTYHSVAILLPDGRIWVSSGTPNTSTAQLQTEIFSPDYLLAGPRPTISGSPIVGPYGGTITIPTLDGTSITKVSLLKLGTTTHHFDFQHRLIWLQIQSISSSGIVVSAPINANLAPPGYYMIHILDGSAVPSIGKIIQIGSITGGVTDTTPPTIGISSPSSRAAIVGPSSGVTVNISGTAFDPQSGIQSVKVSIDSGVENLANHVVNDWSSWSFSAIIKTDGPHTITAVATDSAGNSGSIKIPVTIFFS
jgi:hypothetical protein